KPMIPVAGRPLIDHALDLLFDAGVSRIVVNTHHCPGPLEAHLASEGRVTLSHESELLDTGGGLRQALPLLGTAPVWTLNADAIWSGPNPLASLPAPPPGGAELLLVPKDRAIGHLRPGDFFLNDDNTLTRRGTATSAPYIYTGLQLIDPRDLGQIPEEVFSLNRLWDHMLAEGLLRGRIYPGRWCDVGQPESLPLAEALHAGR
ncbi:MAG: nucleotidyltransferase family protein, partial [Pseudomonadota bacterium]